MLMRLMPLKNEILSCRFDPTGQNIAASSADRTVCEYSPSRILSPFSYTRVTALWRTYAPNTNYGLLPGLHKAPILDLRWSLISPTLYTVSADRTLSLSDLTTGTRTRRIRAHKGVINSIDRVIAGGSELLATASDDGLVRVWESEEKESVMEFNVGCPATSVCWGADGSQVYVGALDNDIHVRLYFVLPKMKC
jgi:Prp8 binding protein